MSEGIEKKELSIEAKVENLDDVIAFVEEILEELGCSMKQIIQMNIAVEEIFVNIASYAYPEGEGMAELQVEITQDPKAVKVTFMDRGIPYDPLAKEDPDISLSVEERQIGGLGIYMVKKSMDDMQYEYKDGKNVLMMYKTFPGV